MNAGGRGQGAGNTLFNTVQFLLWLSSCFLAGSFSLFFGSSFVFPAFPLNVATTQGLAHGPQAFSKLTIS